MEVHLNKNCWRTMQRISREHLPNEATAILVGRRRGEKVQVKDVIEAENILESPTTFKIEPEFVIEVLEKAEEGGLGVVGFFHSHPSLSAFVSDMDEKFMKLWPKKVWMIAGVNNWGEVTEVKAFRFINEDFEEIEIKRDQ